ncbi:MAG: cyclomaltodextrinase N-terminal domain-containing protein [Ignavibacteriaceae bacterium]|nr:cyclomaltodextrinase N-terminal domain-containing protein [Ignavibacteriaceae bacterium]
MNKIEPPNWWVGMKWDTVQLMVYGENLNGVNVRSVDDKLKILNFHSSENGSYLLSILNSDELDENMNLFFLMMILKQKFPFQYLAEISQQ